PERDSWRQGRASVVRSRRTRRALAGRVGHLVHAIDQVRVLRRIRRAALHGPPNPPGHEGPAYVRKREFAMFRRPLRLVALGAIVWCTTISAQQSGTPSVTDTKPPVY